MTSAVVDHLVKSQPTSAVAVLYLSYVNQHEQSLRCFMAALLRQLAYSDAGVFRRWSRRISPGHV